MNISARIADETVTGSADSISVIIPTYKRPKLLPLAIKSALDQSKSQIEIIVSDNDPAGSAHWINDTEGHVPLVYVSASAITGASFARNAGAQEARGDWIAFLDDDDRWSSGYLDKALERGVDRDVDMVLTPLLYDYSGEIRPGKKPREGVSFETILRNGNFGIGGSNTLIRSKVFRSLGGFDLLLPSSEDIDLFVRFARGGFQYAVTDDAQVVASIHDGQRLTQLGSMALYTGTKRLKEKYSRLVSSTTKRKLSGRLHERGFLAEKDFRKKLGHAFAAALGGNMTPLGELLRALIRVLKITPQ